MSYPRRDTHRHRGVPFGASIDSDPSAVCVGPDNIPPHTFSAGVTGANTMPTIGRVPPRRDRCSHDGNREALPYRYSPLEYSNPLDNWQISAAAASELTEVVLGESANLGETATTHSKAYRMAVKRTLLSLSASLLFGLGMMLIRGRQSGLEFIAGYLVEQSLSVDNLFVFLMTFDYFQVPLEHQGRVLTWGIVGAIVMRGVMITLGVTVVTKFKWITLVFAAILLFSSYKLFVESDDEEHDLSQNTLVRVSKRLVGSVDEYDGDRFFTKLGGKGKGKGRGKTVATPLLLCLVCIELSDFVFAVDSIPAILGVSKDSFVLFSSNFFAIMALRSIYVIIAQAVNQLPYLKPAVALVLGFISCKMFLEFLGCVIRTGLSLFVVASLIGGGVGLSLLVRRFPSAGTTRHKRRRSGDLSPRGGATRDDPNSSSFV